MSTNSSAKISRLHEPAKKAPQNQPEIWALGGGKGGVGKSVLSVFLAYWLAKMGKRTVLVDLDLGGANIHTLLGIPSPQTSLGDFIAKRKSALEEICINTQIENLGLISGTSEILTSANPVYAQKIKIIRNLRKLNAEYIVLDLGAGASYNVLDFFLIADKKITVLTPQATSIQNGYAFLRNAVYRKLSFACKKYQVLNNLIDIAADPQNQLKVRTIGELLRLVEESNGNGARQKLQSIIDQIRPAIVTNMASKNSGKAASAVVQTVCQKYLLLDAVNLGNVGYDKLIDQAVSNMISLTGLHQSSEALLGTYDLAQNLLKTHFG
jgi:flagellar biosynthesis protein FlhG